jgi:hypothetical protein
MSPRGTNNVKKTEIICNMRKKGTFIIRVFNTQNICSTASLCMAAVMGCPGGYKLYMQ